MTVPGKGGPPKGYRQSEEHKAKVAAANRGRQRTPGQLEALAKRNADPVAVAKMVAAVRLANTGRVMATTRGELHWNWSSEPSYLAVHKRLWRLSSSEYINLCVDCGATDRLQWSLKNAIHPANLRLQVDGPNKGRPYSISREDYERRCAHCHSMQDRSGSMHWTKRARS